MHGACHDQTDSPRVFPKHCKRNKNNIQFLYWKASNFAKVEPHTHTVFRIQRSASLNFCVINFPRAQIFVQKPQNCIRHILRDSACCCVYRVNREARIVRPKWRTLSQSDGEIPAIARKLFVNWNFWNSKLIFVEIGDHFSEGPVLSFKNSGSRSV